MKFVCVRERVRSEQLRKTKFTRGRRTEKLNFHCLTIPSMILWLLNKKLCVY